MRIFLFLPLCAVPLLAQKQEVGLTLGGLFPQDRGTAPNAVRLGGGTALQANYGYRFWSGGKAALYGEVHFLANPQRIAGSGNGAATRDVATIYVTPGVRLKFFPRAAISPYAGVGGGYAAYEQSNFRLDGRPNEASRELARGVLDYGGGVDFRLIRFIGLRAEIRDFYSGSPSFNLPGLGGGQHNVVAGGGFVLRWGGKER